jgi:uncharacterized protein GlcG (DUF336 family)
MSDISLNKAKKIISSAFAKGKEARMKPLAVAVVDKGGNLIAFERSDGAPAGRFELADGKANAAIMMGIPTSAIMARAEQQPFLVNALSAAYKGRFIPVTGGVLVTDEAGQIIGAVGVTGDTSENDAAAAVVGIEAAGLSAVA